jgi:D-amino-acid oxidase
LGGSSHETWDSTIDMGLSKRIMQRAIQICPHLVKPGEGIEALDVIHHSAGLRPARIGGPLIEWEEFPGKMIVVHNYGAGGVGFQSSWGMAFAALEQVNMALHASKRL